MKFPGGITKAGIAEARMRVDFLCDVACNRCGTGSAEVDSWRRLIFLALDDAVLGLVLREELPDLVRLAACKSHLEDELRPLVGRLGAAILGHCNNWRAEAMAARMLLSPNGTHSRPALVKDISPETAYAAARADNTL